MKTIIVLKAILEIDSAFDQNFRSLLPAFLQKCRAEEGCLSFVILRNTEQSSQYIFIEEWESEAALHVHEASPHLAEFITAIRESIVRKLPTQVYHVDMIETW